MKNIRAAVIGAGYLGRFHAQKYAQLEHCTLEGVVDTHPATAERVAAELGVRALPDYRALLGKVDAVSIATPTPTHSEIAHAFLQAGAHVLVEKPITESTAQAEELIDAARKAGRLLQVGHLERFNPAILAAETLLAEPRFIECHRLAPFRERGTDVNVVLDLMIHDIDLLQMIVGSPLAAMDAIGTAVFSGEVDIANARLRFQNGCVANVTASRVSLKTERKLRVFRDDAYLSIDLQQKILTVIRKRQGGAPGDAASLAELLAGGGLPVHIEEQSFEQGDALRAEIEAFLAAVRGEAPVKVSGEDGLRALRTAIAITARVRGGDAAGVAVPSGMAPVER
ncbi:MAG TPA: Gfo/Idh/MocA family oxidoreductase [Steroidobacteraceae bacterium]|nr:Gfo/Idh/MocA family oxidoreductase [Steroidobacteraceae bacterium]